MWSIWHVVERVRQVPSVDRVVLAVPSFADAEPMMLAGVNAEIWLDQSLPERDVLARYAGCAAWAKADAVLRVTGDCPLWDPSVGEAVIGLYRRSGVDYTSNITAGHRDGEDAEVFSAAALQRAHLEATDLSDREHVTPWIRRNCRTATLQPDEIRSDVKTSVDTLADLERVRAMVTA
jgi:spore coat polysaccharide biosynthesis protein SpsF (cytidylyltransferase family)